MCCFVLEYVIANAILIWPVNDWDGTADGVWTYYDIIVEVLDLCVSIRMLQCVPFITIRKKILDNHSSNVCSSR